MADTSAQSELLHGEVVENLPPGAIHGLIALVIGVLLRAWATQHRAGVVGVESGFVLARNPDTVRAPDVSFVSAERVPSAGIPVGFWQIAPDLAVEIVSPSESAEDLRDKVDSYLGAGARTAWAVYPGSRVVDVHTPDGIARAFTMGAVLEFPESLPGFRCTVEDIFAPLASAKVDAGEVQAAPAEAPLEPSEA